MILTPFHTNVQSHLGSEETQEAITLNLIENIFARLRAANIPYCLLRNRDEIPHGVSAWKDLDVLIPGDVTVDQLARIFAPLHPAQIGHLRHGQVSFYFSAKHFYLRVDFVYGDLKWKSAAYIDHQEVLSNREDDRGVMVASCIHQAYIVWFSKLLWEGSVPARYEEMICEAVRLYPAEMNQLVEKAFGKSLASQLIALAESGRLADTAGYYQSCRKALWLGQLRKRPATTMMAFGKQVLHGVEQRRSPSGVDVAFLGPDGAGKTTVITAITKLSTRQVAYKNVHRFLRYQQMLPKPSAIVRTIIRREIKPVVDTHDPHGSPPHRPLVWTIKHLYYALDQWINQVKLRKALAHTSLVLKDRHFIELTIDARRYRYKGPTILPRLISRISPKPTLVIVLDAPIEVMQSRKPEVAPAETARQRRAYRDLATSRPNGYIVDSNRPLREVLQDVLVILNRYAEKRTRDRYYNFGSFEPARPAMPGVFTLPGSGKEW